MNDNDKDRIQHILDAAYEITLFVKGKSKDDIRQDRILTLALVKEIEIIGEAASKLSDEVRDQIPDVEWQKVISMRNRLVHVYFEIDHDILWFSIKNNVPDLINKLEGFCSEIHLRFDSQD
jgi:uncharacterized protein with HEPN domain